MESLERLRGLHEDLTLFTATRLANVDRLWHELEASIQDFRQLLDKPTETASITGKAAFVARLDSLTVGEGDKITIGDREYKVNEELGHIGRAVATSLKLEEHEAIQLIIETQGLNINLEQPLVQNAITSFHERRDLLLQDLRLVLREAVDHFDDDTFQDRFKEIVAEILNVNEGSRSNGSLFAQKCLSAMKAIEGSQAMIADQNQSRIILTQQKGSEAYETLDFQKASLFKQHEALAAIVTYLFRGNFTTSEDLRSLIAIPKEWDRLDFQLVHYLPALSAGFRQYGSPDHSSSKDDALSINDSLAGPGRCGDRLLMQPVLAVLSLWWTTEYSGWFREPMAEGPDAQRRAQAVRSALDAHALEFLLSLCTTMNFEAWREPARQEIVGLLLQDATTLSLEEEQTSDFFRVLFMESLESFAEAWITNMPDSIRQLKNEEDDERLLQITAIQSGFEPDPRQEVSNQLHLERFLVLISFAFENRMMAAEELFWQDTDGNLFGFLQWASKRQTVPRVSAFCEMLCAISEGPNCAAAAHSFLLEESVSASSARSRRNPSMNYTQMFAELALYAQKVHERPATTQVPQLRKSMATDMNELESPVMLSCYLRLIAHMSRQTNLTRDLILGDSTLDFAQVLLTLSSGPVPSYVRASIFNALQALLTEKTSSVGSTMWRMIDHWAANEAGAFNTTVAKPEQSSTATLRTLQNALNTISISFDQSDAFLALLCSLMAPAWDDASGGPILPFPADLGASYRATGISPYVDFVCDLLFVKRLAELSDSAQHQVMLGHCLDFIVACLASFNENYVAFIDRMPDDISNPHSNGSLTVPQYVQIHPFARTMRWLYSSEVNKALLTATHRQSDDVLAAQAEAPLLPALAGCIDVLNLVLDTQPSYLDIVRPMLGEFNRDTTVPSSAVTTFEDTIAARPELVHDLCNYAASADHALVYKSLNLLERLSRSKRFNHYYIRRGSADSEVKRLVDMLGPNASSDLIPVSSALASHLELLPRELEADSASPAYEIKDTILTFLSRVLASSPDRPNIAHLLLGFARMGERLVVPPDGMLENGRSVFNAILDLLHAYPDGINESLLSWLLHIKTACIKLLHRLWSSQLSSQLALTELRRYRFLQNQLIGHVVLHQSMLWDGRVVSDPTFWLSSSAEGLHEFLQYRACLYDYAAKEIRDLSESQATSLQKQWLSAILGKPVGPLNPHVFHASLYSLADFLELDLIVDLPISETRFFADIDVEALMSEETDDIPALYDLDAIREILRHRIDQLLEQSNSKVSSDDEDSMTAEANLVVTILAARNRHSNVQHARRQALHGWVEVVVAALECCSIDDATKLQFILQMMQTILPKLDAFVLKEVEDSYELARAADALLLALSQIPSVQMRERTESNITERLFQLFRVCIDGVVVAEAHPALRAVLYSICTQYLSRVLGSSETNRKVRRNALDCIRSAGIRLIGALTDDAEDGIDSSRPGALTLLGFLQALAREEKSSYVVDSLVRANAIEALIDPIKNVAAEFQGTAPALRQYLLTVLGTRMMLLLQISRTREGAGSIIDAGLLPAIRNSTIFSADPDLGIDIDNAEALHNYYQLVSSILRVLVSTFLSRGVQNEQCQFLMRTFLQDNRPNMVGLFKRYHGVTGKAAARSQDLLKEIVSSYVALLAMSGFVEYEEEDGVGGRRADGFS